MASQSYQLSFGVTLLVIFLCLILILILLAAGLRATFTIIFYVKHIWRSIIGQKTEKGDGKSSGRFRRKENYEDDYGNYADDEVTDSTSDRTDRLSDRYAYIKSKEE